VSLFHLLQQIWHDELELTGNLSHLFTALFDLICRDANNPLDMKPLPKEPDDERRKKSKAAKGTYSVLSFIILMKYISLLYILCGWKTEPALAAGACKTQLMF